MDRTTSQITTTNGHIVVLHQFITGREQRDIRNVFLKNVEIGRLSQLDGKQDAQMSGFSAQAVSEAQDLALQFVVVSVDGVMENVVEAVLNLKAEDTEDIINAVNEITAGKKK